jgi:hypothetical protein
MLLGVGAVWAFTAWAADKVQPLDVKVGLWEVTHTTTMEGQLIPPEAMAKLSPEHRAQVEQMLKQRSEMNGKPVTRTHCVTKEELAKSDVMGDDERDPSCKRTVITSTPRKLQARSACADEKGGKRSGSYEIEAVDREHVKGSAQMTGSSGKQDMKANSTFTARWLGADCGKDKN